MKTMQAKWPMGIQVVYVPSHIAANPLDADLDHPSCEEGFVTSQRTKGFVFCRYWNRKFPHELRTTANSESTPVDRLIIKETRPDSTIKGLLAKYGYIRKEGEA